MNRIAILFFVIGISVEFSSAIFSESLPGDGNGDGIVDSRDAIILQENWYRGADDVESMTLDLPDPLPLRLVRIPAGIFMMGSPNDERSRDPDEGPVHSVTIGHDFYMGETEVTQSQWRAVMGSNPERDVGEGDDHPVYNVTWDDCQEFLGALNALGQGTYRLPSEAEWEYACRAGTTTRFSFGDSLDCDDLCTNCLNLNQIVLLPSRISYMWFCRNSQSNTHPVREKRANAFGLFDMSGNVWEWCQDSYHDSYIGAPNNGSAWISPQATYRVIRGGAWLSDAHGCRSASRYYYPPDFPFNFIGFRIVKNP